jgi:hypothetical protein
MNYVCYDKKSKKHCCIRWHHLRATHLKKEAMKGDQTMTWDYQGCLLLIVLTQQSLCLQRPSPPSPILNTHHSIHQEKKLWLSPIWKTEIWNALKPRVAFSVKMMHR